MVGVFVFSAQSQPVAINEVDDKLTEVNYSSKRAQSEKEDSVTAPRKVMADSFKPKFMNMGIPNNWAGFGSVKEKLNIGQQDITNIGQWT
ncbi:hypothetical protein ACOSP7_029008 [Xanthoceras sorbifolium]